MPQARSELAELVAFKSVADPRAVPARGVRAGRRAGDRQASARSGFEDVAATTRPTAARRSSATRPAPPGARPCSCTPTTTCSPRSARTSGRSPVCELTERDGRWYGRGAADCKGNIVMHLTALRASAGRQLPGQRQACRRRLGGAGDGRSRAVRARSTPTCSRADAILVCDTGNFAVGVPDRHDDRCVGSRTSGVTVRALSSAMHSRHVRRPRAGRAGRADPHARDPAGRSRATPTIDGLRRHTDLERRRLPAGAVPQGRERARRGRLIGDGTVVGHALGPPRRDRAGHRLPAGGRLGRRDPARGAGAHQPARPARE